MKIFKKMSSFSSPSSSLDKNSGNIGDPIPKKVLKMIEQAEKKEETALDLSNQKLFEFPESLWKLSLKKLNLSRNHLHLMDPSFNRLKETLVHIDLSRNELETLDPSFCELYNVKFLHLSFNKLSSLPPNFGDLKALEELYLDNNCFEHLSEPVFYGNKKLIVFDLSFNKLTRISHQVIDQFAEFPHLESLFLNNNKLSRLPNELGNLLALQKLDVSHNCLVALPRRFAMNILKKLTTFNIEDNPTLEEPPFSICISGPDAIYDFFEKLEKQTGIDLLFYLFY